MTKRKYFLGPACIPQWILAFVPFAKKFGPAAKRHDVGYAKGGDAADRELQDMLFYQYVLIVCGYNPFAYIFAVFYYLLTRSVGGFFFNWREK